MVHERARWAPPYSRRRARARSGRGALWRLRASWLPRGLVKRSTAIAESRMAATKRDMVLWFRVLVAPARADGVWRAATSAGAEVSSAFERQPAPTGADLRVYATRIERGLRLDAARQLPKGSRRERRFRQSHLRRACARRRCQAVPRGTLRNPHELVVAGRGTHRSVRSERAPRNTTKDTHNGPHWHAIRRPRTHVLENPRWPRAARPRAALVRVLVAAAPDGWAAIEKAKTREDASTDAATTTQGQ